MKVTLEGAQLCSNLSWLGKLVWEGKEIVLLKDGQPYLKLLPHPDGEPSDEVLQRPVGLMKDQIWISPDFDEPDQDIIDAFEGKYSNDSLFEPSSFTLSPAKRSLAICKVKHKEFSKAQHNP